MSSFLNRCIWNPTAGGLTDFVVQSAFTGAYTPAQCLDPVVADGAGYHYFAATADNSQHEEGDGFYSVATGTLTRTTIRNSSSGGSKVNFSQVPIVTMGNPTALDLVSPLSAPTPVPQTIQTQSVRPGTSNTPGAPLTVNGSFSTGVGEPGFISFNGGFVGYDVGRTLTSISNGSPAVFTSPTPHNLFGGQCILLQTTGSLPSGLSTLTQYFVDQASLTATTFEVATSFGGTPINTTTAGSGTHSYVPGGVVTGLFQSAFPAGPATLFLTAFAGGLVDGMIVQFQSTGTLPTGLLPNTNYFVIGPSAGSPGFEFFAVSLSQTAVPPIVATGGSGTLTYQVQGNIQNQPLLGVGWSVGPSNLVGNDAAPLFGIKQTWNSTLSAAPFAPLGNLNSTLLGLTINNLRNTVQKTSFSQYNASGTNLNSLNCFQAPSPSQGSWALGAGFHDSGPLVEFHNANFPDNTLGMVGNPVEFATQTSFSTLFGHPAPIGVLLGYDGVNGLAGFYNPTPSSPAAVKVYNTTDNTSGAPTNYERLALDWQTTANVARISMQTGGSGTPRIIAVDGFQKAGAPVAGDLPSGTWGVINDTVGNATWLCYNNSGTLRKVQLV